MGTKLKGWLPAFGCALIPVLCYLLIRPYAEFGICDDALYIRDAQKLALTGHIAYGGAEGPMLGWQLYLGAFLIKLLGFSFTAVRFSTVIEAAATAFLLQRTFLRAGINSRNAALVTVAFVLSPLYFPYVYTFMSDISGVLCIVASIYMCLRALDAKTERTAIAWIVLATLSSGVPATAILGPDQYEWWVELNTPGYINDPNPTFRGAYIARYGYFVPPSCEKNLFYGILLGGYPDIQPAYAVSTNPQECGGQVAFPPVIYRTWIAPRANTIYALRLPLSFPH